MKLRAIIHNNDYHLATESGEIIENSESCEIDWSSFKAEAEGPITITFKVRAIYGNPGKVVDAGERAVRALPSPFEDTGDFFYGVEQEWEEEEDDITCPNCGAVEHMGPCL